MDILSRRGPVTAIRHFVKHNGEMIGIESRPSNPTRLESGMARRPANVTVDHYRHGLAASHAGDPAAQALLATALARAKARGDERAVALAAAALLIEGQVRATYRRFPELIADAAPVREPAFAWAEP
jgi:hypothetical protein